MIPRLKERYKKEIVQNLMSKLNYKNINAVPRIEKVVINMGLGQEASDKKKMETCLENNNIVGFLKFASVFFNRICRSEPSPFK